MKASAGNIVAGVILMLGAIVCLLLGGGCTVLLFGGGMSGAMSPEIWPLLLISLAILGAGVGGMWIGLRLITGKYD